MRTQDTSERGAIAIIIVLGLSAFAFAVLATMSTLAASEVRQASDGVATEKTFYAAETGVNEGLYQLATDASVRTFCLDFEGNQVDCTTFAGEKIQVDIEAHPGPNPEDRYKRIIRSTAVDVSGKERTLTIAAITNSFTGGLDFAAHAGAGGILMDNNSYILGDVYSNGDIVPTSSGAKGTVQPDLSGTFPGNVTVSGTGMMEKVLVEVGDVRAHTIKGTAATTIGGHAYYQELIDTVKADGGAETCSTASDGTFCHRNSTDSPFLDFLIQDDPHVQNWIANIEDAGNPNAPLGPTPGACPPSIPADFYCVTDTLPGVDATFGRQKFYDEGNSELTNFYIDNNATVQLTGDIYITGKLVTKNGSSIVLDSDLGGASAVIIVEDTVDISPGMGFSGSGDPRSFINVISRSDHKTATEPAISGWAQTTSVIFTALDGMLYVKNGAFLNAAMAYVIQLENTSKIQFSPDLAAFTVPSPTPTPTGVEPGSWLEE